MSDFDIAGRRLRNQLLVGPPAAGPEAVIRHFVAVQAQEYPHAKWGVAQRTQSATNADLDAMLASGALIRTHPMRPTWHVVLPEDIRWLLAITGPRVHVASGSIYRKEGLDEATLRRGDEVMARALEGGRFLTRAELKVALEAAGISASGLRLGYLVMHAELEAVICSGPMRGKQFTYALFDERVPPQPAKDRDEAVAELALRYFRAHGPATVHDFSWWSGLTMGDCRAGAAAAGDALVSVEHNGKTYWMAPEEVLPPAPSGVVHLLPVYDEHVVAYRDHGPTLHPEIVDYAKSNEGLLYANVISRDGLLIGGWRRTVKADEVIIETTIPIPLGADEQASLEAAAERYGRFLGLPVSIVERKVDGS